MVVDDESTSRILVQVLAGVISFGLYVALRLTVDGALTVSSSVLLTPSAGVAIPLGIVFGLPAAVGLLTGYGATQFILGSFHLIAVFEAASIVVLAGVSALAWKSTIDREGSVTFHISGVTGFVFLTAVVSVGSAATLAWGGELLGFSPFYVSFVDALFRYLLATVIVAPVVLLFAAMANTDDVRTGDSLSHILPLSFAVIPLLWSLLAVIGSIGFTIRERIPLVLFEEHGIEILYHLVHPEIFGQGGRRVQVAFGAVMLLAWMRTFGRNVFSQTQENSAEDTYEGESVRSSIDSDGASVSSSRTEDVEVR